MAKKAGEREVNIAMGATATNPYLDKMLKNNKQGTGALKGPTFRSSLADQSICAASGVHSTGLKHRFPRSVGTGHPRC